MAGRPTVGPQAAQLIAIHAALVAALAGCHAPPPELAPERSSSASSGAGGGRTASAEQIKDAHVQRAEDLLIGRFPGVNVYRLPNGSVAVRIRSAAAAFGAGDPLFVVDGMPITPGPGGALYGIVPEHIARIEVLKDIGSTSYYGSRGANGVVLITTRR